MSFWFAQQSIDDSLKREKALAWIAEEIRHGSGVSDQFSAKYSLISVRALIFPLGVFHICRR
ncbi:MAG: hypothetical protein EBS82_01485 [Methylocystaceae bacterium]|jgi:hypothetical protein|nr:hypothetical protein [Methylocystaceae bacterium]NBT97012.1 hypothetical protein [Methylocystaceae bacterium]